MKLYFVATPIGNFKDMTFRGLEVLKSVDLILAEDTRISSKLLKHYQIKTPMKSYHMHNEHYQTKSIVDRIKSGTSMAMITDAGTPSISDPGFLLTRACIISGVEVECLPGATAFIPALVNSGFASDKFVFEGFLPVRKGLKKRLSALTNETRTIILYESPHRLLRTLDNLISYMGEDRLISVSKELTKFYEQTIRGTLSKVKAHFNVEPVKGEFVLVIKGIDNKKYKESKL